jgi:hypothetical protein
MLGCRTTTFSRNFVYISDYRQLSGAFLGHHIIPQMAETTSVEVYTTTYPVPGFACCAPNQVGGCKCSVPLITATRTRTLPVIAISSSSVLSFTPTTNHMTSSTASPTVTPITSHSPATSLTTSATTTRSSSIASRTKKHLGWSGLTILALGLGIAVRLV